MIVITQEHLLKLIYYPYTYEDNYTKDLETMIKTAHILRKLRDDIFWSNILLNDDFKVFLDSFLKNFKRIEVDCDSDNGALDIPQKTLFETMFHLILRILSCDSAFKFESNGTIIDSPMEVLYDYKLWTFPMLMDFITLYIRHTDFQSFHHIVERVFERQPLYRKDFQASLIIINQSLKELLNTLFNLTLYSPEQLKEDTRTTSNILGLLVDMSNTLDCFFRACRSESFQFFNCKTFYYFNYLYNVLSGGILDLDQSYKDILDSVLVRMSVIANVTIRNVVDPENTKDMYNISDYVRELQLFFRGDVDMGMINSDMINLEEEIHNKLIIFSVNQGFTEILKSKYKLYHLIKNQVKLHFGETEVEEESELAALKMLKRDFERLLKVEAVNNISALFPDLGIGFIVVGIYAYDENEEVFINALLEQSLKSPIQNLERSLDEQTARKLLFPEKVIQFNISPVKKVTAKKTAKPVVEDKSNEEPLLQYQMYDDEPDDSYDYFPHIDSTEPDDMEGSEIFTDDVKMPDFDKVSIGTMKETVPDKERNPAFNYKRGKATQKRGNYNRKQQSNTREHKKPPVKKDGTSKREFTSKRGHGKRN